MSAPKLTHRCFAGLTRVRRGFHAAPDSWVSPTVFLTVSPRRFARMPLTLLVGTAALTLLGFPDSTRAVTKPAVARPVATSASRPASRSDSLTAAATAPAVSLLDRRYPVDSILVEKSARRLSLFQHGRLVRIYAVALGQQPVGDKVRRGDKRTPEGRFRIEARNPQSRYHRALRISYPDAGHRARAQMLGVSPGGDIMIHGLPARQAWVGAAHRDFDWTEGCIALTNQEIDEIWSAVPVGTPIHIMP